MYQRNTIKIMPPKFKGGITFVVSFGIYIVYGIR